MLIVAAVLCGFCLDLVLGDPPWMPHPVVFMGKCITALEALLRCAFPKSKKGELLGGAVLAVTLPIGTFLFSAGVLWLCGLINPILHFALETVWCWQAIAVKGLWAESINVYTKLTQDTIENARKAVSRIVGRDTRTLSNEGVIKATVETVAENFADGVAAPLLYMIIGGAPLALVYKSINTMDSMVGYKNEKYLFFGRVAAKLDDVFNYIPARLAAVMLWLAAWASGQNAKRAFYIWKRDRRNHASPNSAQTEAVMAGALDVQLAGPACYFGKLYEKPTIGDAHRPVEAEDIKRADRMMYTAGIFFLILLCGVRTLIIYL